jgi:formylglycine-generating enzyme required for sulfatase activity
MPTEKIDTTTANPLMSMGEAEGRGRQWVRDIRDAHEVFRKRLPLVSNMTGSRRGSKMRSINSLAEKILAPAFILCRYTRCGLALGLVFLTAGVALGQPIIFVDGFESDNPFRDCDDCPMMVNIPAGSFQMGDLSGAGSSSELPVHTVAVPAFVIGMFEVTFNEWDACFIAGGCSQNPSDFGWGRGTRPVINVNWNDMQEYVAWVSATSGKPYRLPSESECQYATRAGTSTEYWWGDSIGSNLANCGSECGDSFPNTSPVGSFSANPFGLFDVHGNVEELTADCWNENYNGAPTDGSAWLSGDCGRRASRDGSSFAPSWFLRSAHRGSHLPTSRAGNIGFRIARDS